MTALHKKPPFFRDEEESSLIPPFLSQVLLFLWRWGSCRAWWMSTFSQPAPRRAVPPGSPPSSKQKYLITLDFDAHLQLLINCGWHVTSARFPKQRCGFEMTHYLLIRRLSALHCQETLRNWREMESARKLISIKARADETSADAQPLPSGRETSVEELNQEFKVPRFLNGILASKETKDLPVDVTTHKSLASFFQPQPNNGEGEAVAKGVAGVQQPVRGYEWIEMGVRRQVLGARVDEAEKRAKPGTTNESGSVFRNNHLRSVDPVDTFPTLTAGPLGHSTAGPHFLLVGEYPAVDYPMNDESNSTTATSELSSIPGEGLSHRKDSEFQPGNQDTWRSNKQPDVLEIYTWNFSHNLKSPRLRKKRPNGSSQGPSNQTPTRRLDSSFSKSHSDYHHNNKRNSVPSELGLASHSVSLQKGTWKTPEKIPPDPQTLSEPELPTIHTPDKRLQGKAQRSASIPNFTTKLELSPNSSSLQTLPQCRQNSPLEGLLERAKERVKERHAFKNDRNLKVADSRTHYPPPSPSFSTPHSASPSDGDRETEEEVEVELTRYRALAVSDGWKEQLVDGDEDYRRDRWV